MDNTAKADAVVTMPDRQLPVLLDRSEATRAEQVILLRRMLLGRSLLGVDAIRLPGCCSPVPRNVARYVAEVGRLN